MKLVFPDEQGLLLGDTGWFPGALGYRFIFEASTQNVERYVLLDTMPQAPRYARVMSMAKRGDVNKIIMVYPCLSH